MRTAVCTLSVLFCTMPGALAAQELCGQKVTPPAAGQFAEYVTTSTRSGPGTMRMSMIGGETRGSTTYQRLEFQVARASQPDKPMTLQVLIPRWPEGVAQVEEVVMQQAGGTPMKLSGPMVQMARAQMQANNAFDLSKMCEGVTAVGPETVTVPAGAVKAIHYKNAKYDSDVWVSRDVPFMLVKSAGKEFTMELAKTGSGAKSQIVGTPTEMQGLPGGLPAGVPKAKP